MFLPVPLFSLWSFRQPDYGLAKLRFRDGARVFIFVKELRTDASAFILDRSGFNPRYRHSESAFHCCRPVLQN
jgi:hypothetical protein